MQSNSDLNNNLIKSLNSVHLPPPPAQRIVQAPYHYQDYELAQHQQLQQMNQLNHNHYQQDLSHTELQTSALPMINKDSQRRTSGSINDLKLPLNTPPHSIMRQYGSSNDLLKKKKVQETPLNQTRSKKAKNLLSPQYSSPASKSIHGSSPPIEVSKPPQPTFLTAKQQKKAQRALLKQQQLQSQKLLDHQIQKLENQNKKEEPQELPSPKNMPKIIHNSDTKPPYSYATLIGMAIVRGTDRKLTLSQIYSWISSTFKYYRKNDVGWQNSIRHNLSLNKAFIKTEKSSDGKGHYWEVQKGYEMQFIHGKSVKRSSLPPTSSSNRSSDIMSDPIKSDPIIDRDERITNNNNNDDDNDDNDLSQTPKSQIRSSDMDRIRDMPSLKKNHTAIGLQHFQEEYANGSDTEEDYEDDDEVEDDEHENDPDYSNLRKKRQLNPVGSVSYPTNDSNTIPIINTTQTHWISSSTGEQISFAQSSSSASIQQLGSSIGLTRSLASPPKATRVSSLSSFSCNTNFETSPLKRQETGPLLEPLTPSSRITSFNTAQQLQQQQAHQAHQANLPSTGLHLGPQLPNLIKTPLRNSTNTSGMNTQQNSYVLNFLKTPNTRIKTPNSNSIFKKFWNSPSFIDDFYTSPSIPRYSDDDHYKGLFGSPDKPASSSKQYHQNNRAINLPNLNNILKNEANGKKHGYESSGNHEFSDLFGVDIVSVVKRAVECEKSSFNEKQENKKTTSLAEITGTNETSSGEKTGNSTEDDEAGNSN